MLIRSGLVDNSLAKTSANKINVEADKMEQFMADVGDSVGGPVAQLRIGANKPQLDALVRGRYLIPVAEPKPGSSAAHSPEIRRRFKPCDLEAFLDYLPKLKTKPPMNGMCDLEAARRKAACSLDDALRLLLDGELQSVSMGDFSLGLSAILLDPHELKEKTALPHHGCLSLAQGAATLPARYCVVRKLIDAGHLNAVKRLNPIKRHMQTVIEPTEIARFQRLYVGATELSRTKRIAMKNIRREMGAVSPAFDPIIVRGLYYRRAEVGM